MSKYDLIRAKSELAMLQGDVKLFGAAPEDIERINALKSYIKEAEEKLNPQQS